ncbi:hypothetical protein ACIFQM_08880 [Paenibacillus sp. NRS-1782]|uniref:hypothetical protein n=1 Tax=unclassified Paenibacillus TaxID=185978 RepID=UPI003D27890E
MGTGISGVIGYASGRSNNKVKERELLSKDEQAFRVTLMDALSSHKEEIHRLSEEIAVLQTENLSLLAENRSLNAKVEALVARLEGG